MQEVETHFTKENNFPHKSVKTITVNYYVLIKLLFSAEYEISVEIKCWGSFPYLFSWYSNRQKWLTYVTNFMYVATQEGHFRRVWGFLQSCCQMHVYSGQVLCKGTPMLIWILIDWKNHFSEPKGTFGRQYHFFIISINTWILNI